MGLSARTQGEGGVLLLIHPPVSVSATPLRLSATGAPAVHAAAAAAATAMEKVQHLTRTAMRRASQAVDVPPQVKRNLQELFVNFCLILICLLLMYIIVLLV